MNCKVENAIEIKDTTKQEPYHTVNQGDGRT